VLSGRFLLAVRHTQRHPGRSVVLVLCLAAAIFVPLSAATLMQRYERDLGARAAGTPLLVGTRGSRVELVLQALYFRAAEVQGLTWRDFEELTGTGRGLCVPLHVGCRAQGRPLVATTPEYAEVRGLALREGTDPLRIGEATLGAGAARALGFGVGDTLHTDQEESYDLARPPSLALRVVGVYEARGTADDEAVFVDVKTAWAALGLGHGHVAPEEVDEALIVSRAPGSVRLSGALVEHAALDGEAAASFHLHAGAAGLPLSGIIVVPHSPKDGTLLRTSVESSRALQAVVPSAVVDELLGLVLRVKRFFDLVGGLLAVTTAVLVALVWTLSSRLRAAEMRTLARIGAPRSTRWILYGLELGLVLGCAVLLALGGVALTMAVMPNLLLQS